MKHFPKQDGYGWFAEFKEETLAETCRGRCSGFSSAQGIATLGMLAE
jgi:hypothetical protein